ncbi:iron-sulfur cluster biosynthesis family protein [Oceanobacillus piezotolerans]|uniref:Iron-sulfur cluster biosynthesis family protein n=1 Tax=Oceanobacillus piezotolerans TaxID=2448030 RepID=A0A498D9X7_9BACI|nr:iron-sulfur cluster biosynthesis family protein [Oceanobacillus piezotolerans]RLL48143.1 iron-sulfur cluster biosynthesis family protein [Oceanobacillus piezotolerans]
MQLSITPIAEEKLKELRNNDSSYLLLWYDTDGCGCGVNGLPTIRFTNEKQPFHVQVSNAVYPTIIAKQQAVFFAEDMKLDYKNGSFRLTTSEEMLNPFIPVQSILEKKV